MTNYSWEEFRQWVRENPEFNLAGWKDSFWNQEVFVRFVEGVEPYGSNDWGPYKQAVAKWKALIDEREREREVNMIKIEKKKCRTCRKETLHLDDGCVKCQQPTSYGVLAELFEKRIESDNNHKEQIIAQWKQKLTTFLNQRKTILLQEITLIKEALHD